MLGLLGSTVGLGLGVVLAMAIRGAVRALRPRPRRPAADLRAAHRRRGVRRRRRWSRWPRRGCRRGVPAGSRRSRRCATTSRCPESSMRRRLRARASLMVVAGRRARPARASSPTCRTPATGSAAASSRVLLGVTAASPGDQPPVPGGRPGGRTPRVFGRVGNLAGQNSLRNPRRTTATASALMIGLALACTMAIVGDSAKASVDKTIAENFVGDYVVSNASAQPFSPEIARRMAKVRRRAARWSAQRYAFVEARRRARGADRARPAAAGRARAERSTAGSDCPGRTAPSWSTPSTPRSDAPRRRRHGHASASCRPARRTFPSAGSSRTTRWSSCRWSPRCSTLRSGGLRRQRQLPDRLHRPGGRGPARPAQPRRSKDLPIVTVQERVAVRRPSSARPIDQLVLIDLRPARAGAGDRGARHRQHPRAVDHRADPRGGAAARHRARPRPAVA